MKKMLLALLGILGLAALAANPVQATEADNYFQCAVTSASGVQTLGWCPVSPTYPFPVNTSVTFSGAANPQSTLQMTSATTQYTAGWLVASNATAGSVVVPSFTIGNVQGAALIPRVRLYSSDTANTWGAQTLTVDLWTAAPTFTNGDRGAYSPATGTANHLGSYSCIMSAVYGDGSYAECAAAVGNFSLAKLAAGQQIWWSLTATSGSTTTTTASKTFVLTAEVLN